METFKIMTGFYNINRDYFYLHDASDARVLAVICLSVCVCLSHTGVVSKRLNVGSRKQCHVIVQGI